MKSRLVRSLLLATASVLPVLAHAHPGHDGDHDFVWDFGHLLSNPLATVACVALLAAAAWGVWRLLRAKPSAQTERAKRD